MSIFTRYAMDALMKTSHPEINRRQCWNLHPHRTPCTTCKDICPYGDQIFTRPNLVKDWDPCTDCGLCVSACRSGCIAPSPEQVQRDTTPADNDNDTIWIGCEKSTRKNTITRLCISALSWEALAYLALSKKIVLDLTPCGECENDLCAEQLRKELTRLVEFFGPTVFEARFTLAYELGARIKNLRYVQFHPTAFAAAQGRERFLISEAVRGEGALLLNCDKERFMSRYDKRGELAPRDVVSRSIMKEAARTGSEDFYLDIRFRGEAFIKNHFPMIYQRCLEEGVDITKECIPVFPCQHYLMGGIDVNVYGDTTVDRLYAAGECSHTGVHGLNRLASNSLLEALVFARRTTYDISRRMRHESSGVTAPAPEKPAGGRTLEPGHRTRIRAIMQKAWFVIPDYDAVESGLKEARAILEDLKTGGYALSADYIEAKSLATVCVIILSEVMRERETPATP